MIRYQSFKFALCPTEDQAATMRSFAGACRYVYNKALALQRARREAGVKRLQYHSLCKELTEWRNDALTSWLAEPPCSVLQQSVRDLEKAYKTLFLDIKKYQAGSIKRDNIRDPIFKKRGHKDVFRYPKPDRFHVDSLNERIYLPKIGWVRFRKSREIYGKHCNVTVTHRAGKWFAALMTCCEVEDPIHPSDTIVGIDMGVTRFATLSDGTGFDPCASFKKHQRRLARYQRSMSRKKKFSKNWRKAKRKVSRLHAKIADVRQDHLHKTSTTISKSHAVVCIEDLQVKNMSTSARGTVDEPGKNVQQKMGLNRAIRDQGWAKFRQMLEYKQRWRGGHVIAVDPRNTSRTCIVCLHVSPDNRKTQSRFECVECGYTQNADVVGAINILRAGHAQLACGDTCLVGDSAQEPTEALRVA
jgi:putative transposase